MNRGNEKGAVPNQTPQVTPPEFEAHLRAWRFDQAFAFAAELNRADLQLRAAVEAPNALWLESVLELAHPGFPYAPFGPLTWQKKRDPLLVQAAKSALGSLAKTQMGLIARLHHFLGENEAALTRYQKLGRDERPLAATLAAEAGRFEEAIRLTDLSAVGPLAYASAGYLHLRNGAPEQALRFFQNAWQAAETWEHREWLATCLMVTLEALGDSLAANYWRTSDEMTSTVHTALAAHDMKPKVLGRYAIANAIGSGASADVYGAFDHVSQQDVAIKILKPAQSIGRDAILRFEHEARVQQSLKHPSIVTFIAYHRSARVLTLERMVGSLSDRLRQGPMPAPEVYALGQSLLKALAAIHQRGLVHRDIKPSNLLVNQLGLWKVGDLGGAHLKSGDDTQTGALVGTAGYMPPEQLRHPESPKISWDLFAAGKVIEECTSSPDGWSPSLWSGLRKTIAQWTASDQTVRPASADIALEEWLSLPWGIARRAQQISGSADPDVADGNLTKANSESAPPSSGTFENARRLSTPPEKPALLRTERLPVSDPTLIKQWAVADRSDFQTVVDLSATEVEVEVAALAEWVHAEHETDILAALATMGLGNLPMPAPGHRFKRGLVGARKVVELPTWICARLLEPVTSGDSY